MTDYFISGDNDEDARSAGVSAWLQQAADSEQEKRLAVAAHLVEDIRAAVYAQTGFRCSAGIAHNKVSYLSVVFSNSIVLLDNKIFGN